MKICTSVVLPIVGLQILSVKGFFIFVDVAHFLHIRMYFSHLVGRENPANIYGPHCPWVFCPRVTQVFCTFYCATLTVFAKFSHHRSCALAARFEGFFRTLITVQYLLVAESSGLCILHFLKHFK